MDSVNEVELLAAMAGLQIGPHTVA